MFSLPLRIVGRVLEGVAEEIGMAVSQSRKRSARGQLEDALSMAHNRVGELTAELEEARAGREEYRISAERQRADHLAMRVDADRERERADHLNVLLMAARRSQIAAVTALVGDPLSRN